MEEVEPRLEQRPRATHGAVAEVIARRFSSGVRRSALASVDCASVAGRLPRPDGVNCARRFAFGAKTPWNRVRCARGGGTSAASLATKSTASHSKWVVPFRHGVFSSYDRKSVV